MNINYIFIVNIRCNDNNFNKPPELFDRNNYTS